MRKRTFLHSFHKDEVIRDYEESAGANYINLHDALAELRLNHERVSRVVEARFFDGLTMSEVAELCGVSLDTAKRDWRFGRAFLHTRLA